MNYSSTVPLNENIPFQKPIKYRNRARSLIQQKKKGTSSHDNKSQHSDRMSVMDKLKGMFSGRSNNSVENIQSAKLKNNRNVYKEEKYDRNLDAFPPTVNQNVEWQPVYHETCKIKLPIEENSPKVLLPQEAVDDWVYEQNNLSKELNTAKIKNNQDDEQINSQNNCFFNKKLSQNSSVSNNEEPYSKFNYYYNYYLVDEYLESLVESQNKKLDATGLDEIGQLYDNVSLNVKPIIMSKHRLENGVPYDPTKIMN